MTSDQREMLVDIIHELDYGRLNLTETTNRFYDVFSTMDGADMVRMVERACKTDAQLLEEAQKN